MQFITIKTCLEFKFLFQIYRFGDGCPLFHCNCYLPWEQGQLERQVALNGVRLQQRVDEGVMGIFNLWFLECSRETWDRDKMTWHRKLINDTSRVILPSDSQRSVMRYTKICNQGLWHSNRGSSFLAKSPKMTDLQNKAQFIFRIQYNDAKMDVDNSHTCITSYPFFACLFNLSLSSPWRTCSFLRHHKSLASLQLSDNSSISNRQKSRVFRRLSLLVD